MAEALDGKFFWESTTKYLQTEVGKEVRDAQKAIRTKPRKHRYEPKIDGPIRTSYAVMQAAASTKLSDTLKALISRLTEIYNVTPEQLMGKDKHKLPCFVRNMLMWLLRRYTTASFVRIGRALGRDHSTVVSNVAWFEKQRNLHEDVIKELDRYVGYGVY